MEKEKRSELLQVVFIILILCVIILMIFTISIFLKNRDIIVKDPLTYGMVVHNFTTCTCIDNLGKDWYSKDGGFIHTEKNNQNNLYINYTELQKMINFSKP